MTLALAVAIQENLTTSQTIRIGMTSNAKVLARLHQHLVSILNTLGAQISANAHALMNQLPFVHKEPSSVLSAVVNALNLATLVHHQMDVKSNSTGVKRPVNASVSRKKFHTATNVNIHSSLGIIHHVLAIVES
jgi:hypothetical protein